MSETRPSVVERFLKAIERALSHRYFAPILGLSTFLDTFLFFIPTDALLVATILANPKRWLAAVVAVIVGSVGGSVLLAAGIESYGLSLLHEFAPHIENTRTWQSSVNFIGRYGNPAIFLTALSPISQQPVVVLAALAKTSLWEIGAWLLAGRTLKYVFLAWIAKRSPGLLIRIPFMKTELEKIKIKKSRST